MMLAKLFCLFLILLGVSGFVFSTWAEKHMNDVPSPEQSAKNREYLIKTDPTFRELVRLQDDLLRRQKLPFVIVKLKQGESIPSIDNWTAPVAGYYRIQPEKLEEVGK